MNWLIRASLGNRLLIAFFATVLIVLGEWSASNLPIDAFPQGNAEIPKDTSCALVQQAGVDAVIIGNAS